MIRYETEKFKSLPKILKDIYFHYSDKLKSKKRVVVKDFLEKKAKNEKKNFRLQSQQSLPHNKRVIL